MAQSKKGTNLKELTKQELSTSSAPIKPKSKEESRLQAIAARKAELTRLADKTK